MKKIEYTVYGLHCPVLNEVRYIGSTKSKISDRFKQHLNSKEKNPKALWLKSLKNNNTLPKLIIFKSGITDVAEARILEKSLIDKFKDKRCLLNTHYNLDIILNSSSPFTNNVKRKTKLTTDNVTEIRKRYKTGKYNIGKLSKTFGCSNAVIFSIVNYHSWQHIKA
jgi:hypothetical protein